MRLQRPLLFCLTLATALPLVARAEDQDISEIVVTATRVETSIFNVPAAISRVSGDDLRGLALGVNLADDVASVPGLLARNRNNYAQDQQISIRGIGANSAFGIRGVRVYQDGIPATGPDGQGQVSQFNLDSADHMMMDWMHQFNPPDEKTSDDETEKYLEDQLTKVNEMKAYVLKAIDQR